MRGYGFEPSLLLITGRYFTRRLTPHERQYKDSNLGTRMSDHRLAIWCVTTPPYCHKIKRRGRVADTTRLLSNRAFHLTDPNAANL